MRIKTIELDDSGNPESITAVLSAREAALICLMIGPTSSNQRNEIMAGGDCAGSDIYNALSDLANRFYEEGVEEMARGA